MTKDLRIEERNRVLEMSSRNGDGDVVMGIYSDVYDDYGYDVFDDGKFNYRGHGDDGQCDVMVMAVIS